MENQEEENALPSGSHFPLHFSSLQLGLDYFLGSTVPDDGGGQGQGQGQEEEHCFNLSSHFSSLLTCYMHLA